jgi:hypothetical protein
VVFFLQGKDVFNLWTLQKSPTWDFRCAVVKFGPGSVTAKVQLNATLPGLTVGKKVEKFVKIEQEKMILAKSKRELFLLGTVKGDLTDRHSEMTITVDITLIEAVLL